jgi:Na+-transporting NADH:ubiquinone oxidoreductase subunit NqrF
MCEIIINNIKYFLSIFIIMTIICIISTKTHREETHNVTIDINNQKKKKKNKTQKKKKKRKKKKNPYEFK